jgi:hypothetical protein|uniref:Uncharacterized protein n=1 Tax=viral metagenome TaxID=1070528 RepID=A0A6C0DKC0_9ZZZZ
MTDILIDNKKIYNFELRFLDYFNFITKVTIILFFIGFFQTKPFLIIEFTFATKIFLALFLIYRFNDYRKSKIHFTELDRKICYSAGIYIIIVSFVDLINNNIDYIRQKYVLPYTEPIFHYIYNYLHYKN